MAKLYFRYGTMNSSKTAQAIMVVHNYKEKGEAAIILKPKTDTRTEGTIQSRAGLEVSVDVIDDSSNIFEKLQALDTKPPCLIVDESQFLSEHHIFELCRVVDELKVPTICYGLKSDFKGNLFKASEMLFVFADKIEEIKTVCSVPNCLKKATMNGRIYNGKLLKEGQQIVVDDGSTDIKYVALCRKHWMNGKIIGK